MPFWAHLWWTSGRGWRGEQDNLVDLMPNPHQDMAHVRGIVVLLFKRRDVSQDARVSASNEQWSEQPLRIDCVTTRFM